jgi:hypothetical protein
MTRKALQAANLNLFNTVVQKRRLTETRCLRQLVAGVICAAQA